MKHQILLDHSIRMRPKINTAGIPTTSVVLSTPSNTFIDTFATNLSNARTTLRIKKKNKNNTPKIMTTTPYFKELKARTNTSSVDISPYHVPSMLSQNTSGLT